MNLIFKFYPVNDENSRMRSALFPWFAIALLSACSSSEDGRSGEGAASEHLYAAITYVYGPDETATTYINLFDSIDSIATLDLARGQELPGFGNAAASGGKLYVSNGESPTITRYSAKSSSVWAEDGRIGFGSYGLSVAPLYANAFAKPDTGWMALNAIDRIVWDPNTLTIRGVENAAADFPREQNTYKVHEAADRGIRVRGERVFWPYYWSNDDYTRFHPASKIAVYDTSTNQPRAVLDAPCPYLDFASQDEAGNLYFSNNMHSVVGPLFFDDAPSNCLVRIKAGEEVVDPSSILRFADLTEGREGGSFLHIANGKGLMIVFHKERVPDPASSDPQTLSRTNNWRFWTVDIHARTARPLDGMDYFAGGYVVSVVDGRTFLLVPVSDFTSTAVYEVNPDVTITKRFDLPRWTYGLVKIR